MTDMQSILNAFSAQMQLERIRSQMTLGALIRALEQLPADAEVDGIGEAHSYRGYYSDLAFERVSDKRKASDVLADAVEALGKEFTGYKGGKYVMDELTPVWVAAWGSCGQKIIALTGKGTFELEDDD